ncbi:MAG: hypothetical protein Kow00133_02570 [Amphiplicatus sp.]
MRPFLAVLSLLIMAQTASADISARSADAQPIPNVIRQYFAALDAVYREGSTTADIERLFDLVNDDVRYVHRAYDADFGRDDWFAAFERNRRNGLYAKSATECTTITNAIPGNGYAAVEYALGDNASGECVPADNERLLVVFKIDDGKLSLIEELW